MIDLGHAAGAGAAVGGAYGMQAATAVAQAWNDIPEPVRDYVVSEVKGYVKETFYSTVVTWLQNKFTISRDQAEDIVHTAQELKDMIILPNRSRAKSIWKRPGLRSAFGRSKKRTYYRKGYPRYKSKYGYKRYNRYRYRPRYRRY